MNFEPKFARKTIQGLHMTEFASRQWPFIGLRPFELEDHKFFFGREEELNVLAPQVTRRSFVAIVGGSGSGKSSLIRAGLRPKLEHSWKWIQMRPANAPVRKLAQALVQLIEGETGGFAAAWADRFERILTKSNSGIVDALTLISRQFKITKVLLLVDQFEELFRFADLRFQDSLNQLTPAERRDEAKAFVRLLLTATQSSRIPIHVIVTVRSDFIGECARFHDLPEAVSRSQFLVPGMRRDQREVVIRKPIRLAGGHVDPELVQHALIETNEEPDQLPILQHVMMRCWDRALRGAKKANSRPHLTIEDYKKLGGVKRALSVHANEIFKSLAKRPNGETLELQVATKRIFQALTETDQQGRTTRRPQKFGYLVEYVRPSDASRSAAREATRIVVDRFASHDCSFMRVNPNPNRNDNFNVRTDPTMAMDEESIIDIGHEALIRRWNKLQGPGKENWIREELDDADQYRALVRYADADATIPPRDLVRVESWWSKRQPNSFWARRYSKSGPDKFEEIRKLRAASLVEADAANETNQRYTSRLIGILSSAIQKPREYNGAADSLAIAFNNKGPNLPTVLEYVTALYDGLAELRETRRIEIPRNFETQVFAVRFAPTGKLIAVAVQGHVLFYDTQSGECVHSENTPPGWVRSLRWSPDGARIYVGTTPGGRILVPCSVKKLRKYFTNYSNNEWRQTIDIGSQEHPAGTGAWSPDSKSILVAGWYSQASIWDSTTGQCLCGIPDEHLKSNPLDTMVTEIAASSDNERIAVGTASGRIHVFKSRSNEQIGFSLNPEMSLDPIANGNPPYSIAFDPISPHQLFAAYLPSPELFLWKIDENVHSNAFIDRDSGPVWGVSYASDGKFVASASNDHVIRLWTPTDNNSSVQLRGHLSSVWSVDIAREDGRVASGSFDGTIRLWAKDSPLSPTLLSSSPSMPISSKFSVENNQISVIANGGKNYWGMLPKGFSAVSAAAVNTSGTAIAVVPQTGRPALLMEFRDYLRPVTITLPDIVADWTGVAFIENETRIAATTKEGKSFAWPLYSDVHSLEQLAKDHLPLVSGRDGSEKRLDPGSLIPKTEQSDVGASARSARTYTNNEYIIPFRRESEVANAQSLMSTLESRQKSIQWLANNFEIIELNGTTMRNFDLSRIHMMPHSSFMRATLEAGSFDETVLQSAKFAGATITKLTFINADLQSARFEEAVVSKTSFEGADLRFARFDGVRLRSEVNFSQVDLSGCSFRNVTYDTLPNFSRTAWWLASGWNLDQVAQFLEAYGAANSERGKLVGEYPMFDRELSRFETILGKTEADTLQHAVALDGKAWTLAIHGIDLVGAERVARDALKSINDAQVSAQEKIKPLSYVADTLGYVLLQKNRVKEAREVRRQADEVQDPGGLFRYALTLYMLGKEKDAVDMLKRSEQVKRYYPSHELYLLFDYFKDSGGRFMRIFWDIVNGESRR
jgi:WD40 repeat protein